MASVQWRAWPLSSLDRLTQPGHRLVGMVERQSLHAGDRRSVASAGMAVGTRDHQPVQHRQVDGAFDVEAEAPPGQMLAQHIGQPVSRQRWPNTRSGPMLRRRNSASSPR